MTVIHVIVIVIIIKVIVIGHISPAIIILMTSIAILIIANIFIGIHIIIFRAKSMLLAIEYNLIIINIIIIIFIIIYIIIIIIRASSVLPNFEYHMIIINIIIIIVIIIYTIIIIIRASNVLPAFGYHMRQHFKAGGINELQVIDDRFISLDSLKINTTFVTAPHMRIAFAVREASDLTGKRSILNLNKVQKIIKKTNHIKTVVENLTFEHLDVGSTVRYMASTHIFVSVHGAGMTNMFFMNPGIYLYMSMYV